MVRIFCVVSAVVVAASLPARAQSSVRPEARIDAIVAEEPALHAGLGVTIPVGTYVRAGIVGGLGLGENEAGNSGTSGRTDLIARFNLDPFRDRRWAPYAVGGISARYGGSSRTALLLAAGLEGPLRGRITPALELGFAGGVHIAAVLRRGMPRRR